MDETASLAGWVPDPVRPGYLCHVGSPGCLRDADGHGYRASDVDDLRRQVDDIWTDDLAHRVREALRSMGAIR